MDRSLVYPSALPTDVDILLPQQNAMIALGYALQANFGQNTVVVGLACTQTAPASMQVSVGPGAIITPTVIESTPFGSLPANTSSPLVKMGVNTTPTLFTLTAPSTAGQSQNYLVQASFSESDDTPTTLTYYNSLNPSQPYVGPNNSGTPQNTRRAQRANLLLKIGTPANTGTQVTPPVDSGWTGLYVITVSFGITAVTNTAITAYPGAPFLAAFLSSHHGGVPGQAPKINLTSEVSGVLPLANLPANLLTGTLPTVRTLLQANLSLYVSPSGSNNNNGLSVGTPVQTIQKAISIAYSNYDYNGFSVTINLANGTYTTGFVVSGLPVGIGSNAPVRILGNPGSSSSVVISSSSGPCIIATLGAYLDVNGLTILSGGTPAAGTFGVGIGLDSSNSALMSIGNITFGACSAGQMYASASGSIFSNGLPYIVSASSPSHIISDAGGLISINSSTVTIQNTPVFAGGFVSSTRCANAQAIGCTFVGSTGNASPRYAVSSNGVIATNGAGDTYLPGSSAGVSATGGQYV